MWYMRYFLRIIFFFFFISFSFSQKKDWTSTTFDYYWNRVVGQMQFREPVKSSPFEIRFGYYSYGSNSYWDSPFSIGQDLDFTPLDLDSTNIDFSSLSIPSNRSGLLFELDFFRINVGNKVYRQNYLDFQIGLGYKYFNLLNRVKLPSSWQQEELIEENGSYYFRPKIHDFNVNYTLVFQPLNILLLSWYHSLGYSAGYIYETDSDRSYLFSDGFSESFSVGIKIPVSSESANYNFIYGLEYKWSRSYLQGNISSGLSYPINIKGLDIYSNGLFLTFGLLFGGNKTKGDKAYEKMLDKNYGDASNLFEAFIDNHPNHSKLKRAQRMLEFCNSQIPYENVIKTISNINNNNLDLAINNLLIAEEYSLLELESEISARKDEIARILLDSLMQNSDKMQFEEAEKITSKAYSLSPNNIFVQNIHSQLYLKKADILIANGDYSSAFNNLSLAISIYPDNMKFYDNKIMQISILMMDEVNDAFNREDYIVAMKLLTKISEINPSLIDKTDKAISNLKQKLNNKETKHINKLISSMADRYKQERKGLEIKVNLGMTYYEVREAIGSPDIIDKINQYERDFQMWTYYIDDKTKRYYFEDHLLTKIE